MATKKECIFKFISLILFLGSNNISCMRKVTSKTLVRLCSIEKTANNYTIAEPGELKNEYVGGKSIEELYIDLNGIDPLNHSSFKEAIENNPKLPLTIAVVKTKSGKKSFLHFFVAQTLNKYVNIDQEKNRKNPLNNLKIHSVKYYFLNPISKEFDYLGSDKSLWNKELKVYRPLLALLVSTKETFTTDDFLILGLLFEFGSEPNEDLATHFYKIASDQGSVEADYSLYIQAFQTEDKEKAIFHLDKALKDEISKAKLFAHAFVLLSRLNGLINLNAGATLRACQILLHLKQLKYEKCKDIDVIISTFIPENTEQNQL